MSDHLLAIATYGAQRIKHPQTQQIISAYKLGYTSAARAALLAVGGNRAHEVSPKHASYHYVQIDSGVTVRHSYLLFRVSEERLHQVEALTRQHHRAAVFVCRDGQWWELPTQARDYAVSSSGPHFDPSGLCLVDTESGEKTAAVAGIQVETSQRDPQEKPWFWILGDTYPHRETLKRWGCRWSKKRRGWYFIGWSLPAAVEQLVAQHPPDEQPAEPAPTDDEPCSVEEAAHILGLAVKPSTPDPEPPKSVDPAPESEAPKIRIIQPSPLDGQMQIAIQQAKAAPPVPVTPRIGNQKLLLPIPQQPIGELTGSITGQVWCYGYAIHDDTAIYINLGGPRMAVEAIRARLSKGEIVNCVPWDAPAVELTAGEGNTGMYAAFMQNIPEAKFTSLILVHERAITPNYGGKSTAFIFRLSDAQATRQLQQHVTELVKVAVFDAWADYLYRAGQVAMLVRPTRSAGGLDVLVVELDADAWTRLITGGLEQGAISLPQ